MTRPFRQETLRRVLEDADGRPVPTPALLRAIYGADDLAHESAFRQVLHKLRRSRPDLEIEYVGGYRLRRAGRRRDRGLVT